MVSLLFGLIGVLYYQSAQKLMLSDRRADLTKYAYIQTKRLKLLHHFFDEKRTYPRDPRFVSAIYDIELVPIFSLLEQPQIAFDKEIYIIGDKIHFIKTLDTYYLGAKYLILEVENSGAWLENFWRDVILYGLVAFVLFMLLGLYLAKLFVKPMRNSMVLLDRFIKDTTHELNTPLTAILANIEMMDQEIMAEKNRKKLTRITVAAKMVSVLYRDLTYLILEQEKESIEETIALKALIEERVEYFDILARSKQITIELKLAKVSLVMDRQKCIRVLDNLLSNAIKYNHQGGRIVIVLREGYLSIEDTGVGIAHKQIPLMFDRYMRFNQSEGGFGIGLSIVKKIIDEKGLDIHVTSKEGRGTKMVIVW